MRQPADDRALYYRQIRATVVQVFLPQLTTPSAIDAAALVDRILAEFIVEEESGPQLSAEFGGEFAELLGEPAGTDVSPERFHELRRQAADVVAALAGSGKASEQERGARLVDVERRFLERVDELRRDLFAEGVDAAAGDTAELSLESSVTADALGRYLRRRFGGSPALSVTAMQVVPGGRSKETILVTVDGTDEVPHDLIVRKDRPIGLLPTKAADEFAVLDIVFRHGGIPVPEPYFADSYPGELGEGTVLVMARVDGTKAGEYFPDLAAPPVEHRRSLGEQLAVALAHLHSVPLEDLAETNLGSGEVVTATSLTAAVEGMTARIGELSGPPIAAVPLARQWLVDHVADVTPSSRLCLLQGDVGLHNMLVVDDRLTALVDWEAATIGPPARELAAVWPTATALMPWREFVEAYREAGGAVEAIEPRAVMYYRLFFALGACMTSRTGGHLFRTGAKRDLLTAHSGLDAHFRTQRNLARALKDAGAGQ